MAYDHQKAAELALQSSSRLRELFRRAGVQNPEGLIQSVYRLTRKALRGQLRNPAVVMDSLGVLRLAVRDATLQLIMEAEQYGAEQAERELALLGFTAVFARELFNARRSAVASVASVVEQQAQRVEAVVLMDLPVSEPLLLGDKDRKGVLNTEQALRDLAFWIAILLGLSWNLTITRTLEWEGVEDDYLKQAIARVDHRTTDCCLRVNGQVQPLDKPFKLTGTPRYADKMLLPPFHRYCRTTPALVPRESADDLLTRQMKEASREERKRRE